MSRMENMQMVIRRAGAFILLLGGYGRAIAHIFTVRHYASAVYAIVVCVSVCLSVIEHFSSKVANF